MRRKRSPWFTPIDEQDPIYRPPSGCPREKSILCVPIPAPFDLLTDESIPENIAESIAEDPALPCAVVTLTSLYDIPNIRRLENVNVLENVSDAILKSVLDILVSVVLE